jgi:hypothetical protein
MAIDTAMAMATATAITIPALRFRLAMVTTGFRTDKDITDMGGVTDTARRITRQFPLHLCTPRTPITVDTVDTAVTVMGVVVAVTADSSRSAGKVRLQCFGNRPPAKPVAFFIGAGRVQNLN